MKVLFVCTGNTCRSPMAEAIFDHKTKEVAIESKSAGVSALDGQPASSFAQMVLHQKGIEHQHAATRVTNEVLGWADVVLTMTMGHKDFIRQVFPDSYHKTFTLTEYAEIPGAPDIADPYGGDLAVYQQSAAEIEQALEMLAKKLQEMVS